MTSRPKAESKTYLELLIDFPPRLITSKSELESVYRVLDYLVDKGRLTKDEQEYLDLMSAIVMLYEEKSYSIPDVFGVDLLKALMQEHNLRQKDLVPIFKSKSIISEIINGQRDLTFKYIQKLADYFSISPSAFLPLQAPTDQEDCNSSKNTGNKLK